MPPLDYRPLCESWPASGRVSVSFAPFLELEIRIPLDFLARGGSNSLGFLQHLAQQLVDGPGYLRHSLSPHEPLNLDEAPDTAILYYFCPRGERLTHTRGPEGKYQHGSASFEDDDSTDSTSSSTDQRELEFRSDVMMRDGGDLFANVSGRKCRAAHLVPVSRPDIYKALLDVEFFYDVSYGLAMERSLYQAYKACRWSIYYKDDRYYFHAFDGSDPDLVKLHGKSFSIKETRHLTPPDPRLCAWHYRQAVLKHVRGFAVDMQIDER